MIGLLRHRIRLGRGPRILALHAGAGKAGSTAVQVWLARNAAALERLGVLYPAPPAGHGLAAAGGATSGNGGALADFVHPSRRPAAFAEEAFLDRLAAVLAGRRPVVLYSSELLQGGESDAFCRLAALARAAGREIRLVYVVRDIAEHAFSRWTQAVKRAGTVQDWDAFCRAYRAPFRDCLETFVAAFGRDAVTVLNYAAIAEDIVAAVLRPVAGTLPLDTGVERVNRAPSARELALLRAFNVAVAARCADETIRSALAAAWSEHLLSGAAGRPAPLTLNGAQRRALCEHNADVVDYVNGFLGERPIRLAGAAAAAAADVFAGPPEAPLSASEAAAVARLAERALGDPGLFAAVPRGDDSATALLATAAVAPLA